MPAPEGVEPLTVYLAPINPAVLTRVGSELTTVEPAPTIVMTAVELVGADTTTQHRDDAPGWVRAWVHPPGSYGPCPEGGSHLVLICDESGSVHGADPIRYRHALLTRVLATLAGACTCHECTTRLVLFGVTTTKSSASSPALPWAEAATGLAEEFAQLPVTGSYLAPAMDQVEAERRQANTITVCLTDMELFDHDPRRQVDRFAGRPNPLLILLGRRVASLDVSSPTVVVDDQSKRTAVADAVAAHITTARPARQGNEKKAMQRKKWRPKAIAPKWLALTAGGLAPLLLIPLMLGRGDQTSGPVQPQAGQGERPVGPAVADDAFSIPGLGGDAPRTVPMNAVWVIDPLLADDITTLQRIRKELPAVIDYLQGYRIPGDTLALGNAKAHALGRDSLLRSKAVDLGPSKVRPARLGRMAWRSRKADRMLAVITDRPGHWQSVFGKAQKAATRAPRSYIIDASATGGVPRELPTVGPWALPADSRIPGSVAQAVARAWGDAVGARWLG